MRIGAPDATSDGRQVIPANLSSAFEANFVATSSAPSFRKLMTNALVCRSAWRVRDDLSIDVSMSGGSVERPIYDCVVSPLGPPAGSRVVMIVTPVGNAPESRRYRSRSTGMRQE